MNTIAGPVISVLKGSCLPSTRHLGVQNVEGLVNGSTAQVRSD